MFCQVMDTSSEQLIPAQNEGSNSLPPKVQSGENKPPEEQTLLQKKTVNGAADDVQNDIVVESEESESTHSISVVPAEYLELSRAIRQEAEQPQHLSVAKKSSLEAETEKKITFLPATGGNAKGRASPQSSGGADGKEIPLPRTGGGAKNTSPPKPITDRTSPENGNISVPPPPPGAETGTGTPAEESPTESSVHSEASTVIPNEETNVDERLCCPPTCLDIGACCVAYNTFYTRAWNSSFGLIAWIIIFCIPASATVIGGIYSYNNDCPMNIAVPVMVFIMGLFGTLCCFYRIMKYLYKCCFDEFPTWLPNNFIDCGCCVLIFVVFFTEFLTLLGSNPSFEKGKDNYCNPVLYHYSYWANWVVIGLVGISLVFRSPTCYRRQPS